MMGPTMNLISGTHHLCERNKYAFMVLQEYTIISLRIGGWNIFKVRETQVKERLLIDIWEEVI